MTLFFRAGILVCGVVLFFVPSDIFPVCMYAEGMDHKYASTMRCAFTGQLSKWLAGTTIALAASTFLPFPRLFKLTAIITIAFLSLLNILAYVAWPGVCNSLTMPCKVGTVPAVLVLSALQVMFVFLSFHGVARDWE